MTTYKNYKHLGGDFAEDEEEEKKTEVKEKVKENKEE